MWLSPNRLRELIFFILTGYRATRPPIIKIHNRHKQGSTGDLSFPYDIEPWKNLIDEDHEKYGTEKDILTYYKNISLDDPSSEHWDVDNILTAFKRELLKYCKEVYQLDSTVLATLFELTLLTNNTVVLLFHATRLSHFLIKSVLAEGIYYGHKSGRGKRFKISVDEYRKSEITTARLEILKRTIVNLTVSQGYGICEQGECKNHYLLTTNTTAGEKDVDFKLLFLRCGKALNTATGKAEVGLTRETYLNHKIKKIRECYIQRCHEIYVNANNLERDVGKYAYAAMHNEMCTIDYFEPVHLETSLIMDPSTKDAIYVLHTNVRITAILHKYSMLVIKNEYPMIPEIYELTSFERSGDVATWQMIFDYVLEFPDVLANALYTNPKQLIINIPLLWKFCVNLCKDFTKYYQNHPIILTGPHKTERDVYEVTTERLYVLKALRLILRNTLIILGIEEITYM